MIQLSEYRIGNIVCWNPALRNPAITLPKLHILITAIMPHGVGYVSPNIDYRVEPFEDDLIQKELSVRPLTELEAVPLTAAILEESGFDEGRLEVRAGDGEGFLLFSEGAVTYRHRSGQALSKPYASLHALQNLYFALTGEELPISRHSLMG